MDGIKRGRTRGNQSLFFGFFHLLLFLALDLSELGFIFFLFLGGFHFVLLVLVLKAFFGVLIDIFPHNANDLGDLGD